MFCVVIDDSVWCVHFLARWEYFDTRSESLSVIYSIGDAVASKKSWNLLKIMHFTPKKETNDNCCPALVSFLTLWILKITHNYSISYADTSVVLSLS